MPVPQPIDWSGLWTDVRPFTEWPVSNENMVEEGANAWKNAAAAFQAAGAPADDGLTQAWVDEVGRYYKGTIDGVRAAALRSGQDMAFMGEYAAMYAYAVYWAKDQISDSIDVNEFPYAMIKLFAPASTAQKFVEDMAAIINELLDRVAAQIASRGAGGPPARALPVIDRAPLGGLTGVLPEWALPEFNDDQDAKGADRERAVAELVGGTVLAEPGGQGLLLYQDGNTKQQVTDVDVIGPNGNFISVGGNSKAKDLEKWANQLALMQRRAAEQGVRAEVWLDNSQLGPEVIATAIRVVGEDNVHLFW
ncbi:hypothetical protein AB0M54_29010 [Actinoplanes sp. NPDC051470]|uniref:WXG100-like domain-containing protein n=1 Tax=unclassified Actinoplanes TaxID=2626549 RepID=UPI00343B5DEF